MAPALARGLVELVPEYAGAALDFHTLGTAHRDVGCAGDPRPLGARASGIGRDGARVVAGTGHQHLRRDPGDGGPRRSADAQRSAEERTASLVRRPAGMSVPSRSASPASGASTAPSSRSSSSSTPAARSRRQAIEHGYVDVALLFSTDPSIEGRGLVELTDDRKLQPAENVVPLIRTQVRARFGAKLVRVIDDVSAPPHDGSARATQRRGRVGRATGTGRGTMAAGRATIMSAERSPGAGDRDTILEAPPTARRLRRRRRPTGAPPPLPRQPGPNRYRVVGRPGRRGRVGDRHLQLPAARRATDQVDAASCVRSRRCARSG